MSSWWRDTKIALIPGAIVALFLFWGARDTAVQGEGVGWVIAKWVVNFILCALVGLLVSAVVLAFLRFSLWLGRRLGRKK